MQGSAQKAHYLLQGPLKVQAASCSVGQLKKSACSAEFDLDCMANKVQVCHAQSKEQSIRSTSAALIQLPNQVQYDEIVSEGNDIHVLEVLWVAVQRKMSS